MKKNVLILFAKYPEPGKVKTRLAKAMGEQRAADLYRKFLFDLCEAHSKRDYDLVCAFSPQSKRDEFRDLLKDYIADPSLFYAQQGRDLGERMYRAFQKFTKLYEKVLLIGSDLPDLKEEAIQKGFRLLDESDVVIGPAHDGGYYLIGMKKPYPIFDNVSWSTSGVLEQQIQKIQQHKLSYQLLEVRRDIDTEDDIFFDIANLS